MAKQRANRADPGEMFEITNIIARLREDLLRRDAAKEPGFRPLFRVVQTVVEAHVVAKEDIEAEGKVKLYLAQLGAGGLRSNSSGFKISITLEPYEKNPATGALLQGA
jgi:hypothetical protein